MYALPLDKCVDLIAAVGHLRTILAQGDMGNGKSSMIHMLSEKLPKLSLIHISEPTRPY